MAQGSAEESAQLPRRDERQVTAAAAAASGASIGHVAAAELR